MWKWLQSNDPARKIERKCPVKFVKSDEQEAQVVRDRTETYEGGIVWVIGECLHDAKVIKAWAEAKGIPCELKLTTAEFDGRQIPNGHMTVHPIGSKYTLDYVYGVGIVRRKI